MGSGAYFAENIGQDQPVHTCSLMLLCTLFCSFGFFFVTPHQTLLNSLPNDKISEDSKLKASADKEINVTEKLKDFFWKGRNQCGKRRKCWLPAFSPFPTMFSKGLFFKVVKSRDYVVELTK